ncbi:sugar transferase [Candidatus Thioglobus sp.]|nr:sugar transferase [Candidatus Thioglobus sp.]
MIKILFDFIISFIGLLFLAPIILPIIVLVWAQDKKSPFYIAPRSGMNSRVFNMIKLRSMVIDANKSGVDSTAENDSRITPVGHFIRKYKLDEFTQLWNVLIGDMSLVGPRPNVNSETNLYTNEEKRLLSVKPGITDFSSIVFSDESEILKDKEDPNLSYNQLIRPWKSRLGLIYIDNRSILLDLKIIFYTVIAIISKQTSLDWVSEQVHNLNADPDLVDISKRKVDLYPFPPPGSDKVVLSRKIS